VAREDRGGGGDDRALSVGPADERDLAARVAALSLEQKVRLLTGADFWSLHAEPTIGLRRLVVSDGPAGVRGERWDEREPSANVPSPTALAATWDEPLVQEVGRLLAFEARRKGVDVLLAPTVNLHRTPFGGRHFECFSEDPLLTARIGVGYVRGVQGGGVGATVKHFVANDSETERMSLDARVDERALRELYLAPFEAIVREARVWSVMAAYNGVNGHRMTESPLLRDVLHDEWGFDGLVMSDWFATRSTAASARAALDLVMPGPSGPWGAALAAAVREGAVAEATIDDKVIRILRLAARVGALEGSPAAAAPQFSDAQVAACLRRVAAAGFVLARNEDAALPLERSSVARIAVIGPNAATARTLGGGSATVFAPYTVSPLDGLRAALGQTAQIDHAIGVTSSARIPVADTAALRPPDSDEAGVEVRFVAGDGTVLGTEQRMSGALVWMGSFGDDITATDVAWVEVGARLRASRAGTYLVGGSGVGRFRLEVGGEEVFAGRLGLPPGADIVEALMIPPQAVHEVALKAGEEVDVVLAHQVGSAASELGDTGTSFQLNLRPPHGTDGEEIERAVALARDADVAVVVVGTTEEVESEGFDRRSLALPGRQDELVRRVAQVNRRTVVVVNAGAPVLLPWADDVAAVLLAWFPGQEFGHALADVLLGAVEPGGRLPTTWPRRAAGLPSTRPVDGVLDYAEELRVGYRGDVVARFAFGHGLGFTTWEYVALDAPPTAPAAADVTVGVTLRNTGARRGREVVQLYAAREQSSVERPSRWLAGFASVEADPGEEVTVALTVAARAFEHWDARRAGWIAEPGTFGLGAGSSSVVLPLSGQITVT
jgi:beta-glucosidase